MIPARVFVAWLLCAVMVATARLAPAQAPAGEPAKPTREQQRAINKILGQFRSARRDPAKRAEAVQRAIESGPPAAGAMLGVIAREMEPQIQRYGGLFAKQAAAVAQKQVSTVDGQEVAGLQQKVLGLQNREDFSEELIRREAHPALRRLEEIFVVDRAAILDQSESLRAERERLKEAGALWEKCALYLWAQLPEGENKPKDPPSFEAYLQGEESLAAGLAAPMGPQTRKILAANRGLAAKLDPEEARAILALNLTRNLLGLDAVLIDLRLCQAARDHSQDMKDYKFFSHTSPRPGKRTFSDRAQALGTTASAENIGLGRSDGKSAQMGWFYSPGHHKNMLGGHGRVGVGRSGSYYTEMFGR